MGMVYEATATQHKMELMHQLLIIGVIFFMLIVGKTKANDEFPTGVCDIVYLTTPTPQKCYEECSFWEKMKIGFECPKEVKCQGSDEVSADHNNLNSGDVLICCPGYSLHTGACKMDEITTQTEPNTTEEPTTILPLPVKDDSLSDKMPMIIPIVLAGVLISIITVLAIVVY